MGLSCSVKMVSLTSELEVYATAPKLALSVFNMDRSLLGSEGSLHFQLSGMDAVNVAKRLCEETALPFAETQLIKHRATEFEENSQDEQFEVRGDDFRLDIRFQA